MARYASLNRRLDYHLYPQGRSASEPSLIPNVKDSDGNIVQYYSGDRITSESTVVDIGTSPNANDGDPLRTAFIKINNFVEAEYITNEIIDQELNRLEFKGPFLGILDYVDLPLTMISDNGEDVGDGFQIKTVNGQLTIASDHNSSGTYGETILTLTGHDTDNSRAVAITGSLDVTGDTSVSTFDSSGTSTITVNHSAGKIVKSVSFIAQGASGHLKYTPAPADIITIPMNNKEDQVSIDMSPARTNADSDQFAYINLVF